MTSEAKDAFREGANEQFIDESSKLLQPQQSKLSGANLAPVWPAFSEPAKSTRLITENFSFVLTSSLIIYLNSIVIIV